MDYTRVISITVNDFGIIEAAELNFSDFQNGIIALKGASGHGKTTEQQAVKVLIESSTSIPDKTMYGDKWKLKAQLSAGDSNFWVEKKIVDGKIKAELYSADKNGKKIKNPVINGVSATPGDYFKQLTTELTNGTDKLLSESNTVQTKFMFEMFAPELKKFGVITEKKSKSYELVSEQKRLRDECQRKGAYQAVFVRDGINIKDAGSIEPADIAGLQTELQKVEIEKATSGATAETKFLQKQNEIKARISETVEKIRAINKINSDYTEELNKKSETETKSKKDAENALSMFAESLKMLIDKDYISREERESLGTIYKNTAKRIAEHEIKPVKPAREYDISRGRLVLSDPVLGGAADSDITPQYTFLLFDYLTACKKLESLKPEPVNESEFESKIIKIKQNIEIGEINNDILDRIALNQEWIEAKAKVEIARNEIQKLYAKVETGVSGLRMTAFFDKNDECTIKTTYTGEYDPEYFKNTTKEPRPLVSYSSGQKSIIAMFLQVARLKLKTKILDYMFLDNVPMCKTAYGVIAKLGKENGLHVLTSITGDYKREKLQTNEMLIENGEVFFSENK